jgi:hypothetical protein
MFGLFECVVESNWKCVANDEVEEIIPMDVGIIRKLMVTNPEKFTGGFINTINVFCRIKEL